MKKLLLGLILASLYSVGHASTPINETAAAYVEKDSVTLDQLVAMDKKKFKGKTVAEFLNSQEAKGYTDVSFKQENNALKALRIKYSNNLYLNVYLKDFNQKAKKNGEHSWDLEKIKKESIDEIRVVYVLVQEY